MDSDENTELQGEVERLRARVLSLETASAMRFTDFAIEHLPDANYWIREDGHIVFANQAASDILGYSVDELLSKKMFELNVDLDPGNWPGIWGLLKASGSRTFEARHRCRDGRILQVEVWAHFFERDGHEYSCAFIRDLSERKELEGRLRQAEKMEAVGRLAGGVAHDFNNQLAGIMGYADLVRHAAADNPRAVGWVEQLCQVVKVAADLTAQLLAFSRQGKYLLEPVDLHRVIVEVVRMCERSVDKRVRIQTQLAAERSWTAGDPSQLQSAVLNLALNARDAMPEGGTLTLSTANLEFDDPKNAPVEGLAPGAYVAVAVRDTGVGMAPELLERAFEPFFTTKDTGEGTGLGLAAVYGTARHHKGAVDVSSALGKGSLFTLYLPVSRPGRVPRAVEGEPSGMRLRGHVLLVDDELSVRTVVAEMLQALGCTTHSVAEGKAALSYLREHRLSVDLVLLDMIMPGMSGTDTYHAMRAIDPNVQVLLASGYALDGQTQDLIDSGAKGFLQKPFSMAELAARLRPLLRV